MSDFRSGLPVAALPEEARAAFIVRTYLHLFGAIAAFTLLEVFLFTSGLARPIAQGMLGAPWLLILGGFVIVSWLATSAAHRAESPAVQYGALAAYVAAEALIFVPMLFVAQYYAPGVIESAAFITLFGFTALTVLVFASRRDFSFMSVVLKWAGIVALVAIVGSVIFGFTLGTLFSVAMIALAGGAILRDTSNVMLRYPEDRHVGAALQLFASVALMFWYVLRLFLGRRR